MFRKFPWQDVCKFLAGAFFVSAGILFYLYLAGVSVPLMGTTFIASPELSGMRSIVHGVLPSHVLLWVHTEVEGPAELMKAGVWDTSQILRPSSLGRLSLAQVRRSDQTDRPATRPPNTACSPRREGYRARRG